ncbi:translation elongation factor 4 [Candidatus Haliotispira prima]|uniref:Elongation factor 4 n=1 Tax=Candidatus Haliotispira prima TaxID=3034016 RepID=A0ABY8MJC7_9SPIO|nr:translation elongation factor 4 [Candidatus Haliotispira prima]
MSGQFPFPLERIRNFCIIAHIDHGKSTLADRFIQETKLVSDREFQNQLLDSMDIERERGITIKSQAVTMLYTSKDGTEYCLNFIDTPGHVDFSYEVSRAIASCEGALLLVDATQGIEAQTLANFYIALEQNLEIIPVLNKVDLPSADIPAITEQIEHDLGLDTEMIFAVSAKTGLGIIELLEGIIKHCPTPHNSPRNPDWGDRDATLKALIFDSHYDPYRGVVLHIRVFQGMLRKGERFRLMHGREGEQAEYDVEDIGYFQIKLVSGNSLSAGEAGYLIGNVKNISEVTVGDTITVADGPAEEPLPGFKPVKPVVFSSIYPVDSNLYDDLIRSMEKLSLNDASLSYEKDASAALGFGFRCGFLGLLHLEVIQERLESEFDLNIVLTAPSVRYRITGNDGRQWYLDNPAHYPKPNTFKMVEEPYIRAAIITPGDFLGGLMALCSRKRGIQKNMHYLDTKRVELVYEMPLGEILFDFYDKLKSVSRGYASFDYEIIDYQPTELSKVDILINGDVVDALALLTHKDNAQYRGRAICEKLSKEIPRHQFKIPIQAAIGGTIIARETINALRKDVTAKCYGGDITRKKKLLEKQKEGKKRMKMVGSVELPQSAFLAALKSQDTDS